MDIKKVSHGLDGSRYQNYIDFPNLRKYSFLDFLIWKVSQGSYFADPKFSEHSYNSDVYGYLQGGYHWVDPISNRVKEVDFFSGILETELKKGRNISFIAADTEQYWADWQEYYKRNITKFLSSAQIADSSLYFLETVKARFDIEVILYTNKNFVNSYSKKILEWAKNYKQWLAQYVYWPKIYYHSGVYNTTWDDIFDNWLPDPDWFSNLYDNGPGWTILQYSGDKYSVPYIYANEYKQACAIDLDCYYADFEQMKKDFNFSYSNIYNGDTQESPDEEIPEEPESPDEEIPEEPEQPVSGKILANVVNMGNDKLNVRVGPGTHYAKIGEPLPEGSEVEILDIEGQSAWAKIVEGKYCAITYNGKRYLQLKK